MTESELTEKEAYDMALALGRVESGFFPFAGDTVRVLQMSEEELQKRREERERSRPQYIRERVSQYISEYGPKSAPRFIDAEGIGLEDVVKAVGLRTMSDIEALGYTPYTLRELRTQVKYDGTLIDTIYRQNAQGEMQQVYPPKV